MKILKWTASFLIIISASVYLIYSAYRDVKERMIGALRDQEIILAKQAAKSVENLIDNYWFDLDSMSKNMHIVDMDQIGEQMIKDFLIKNSQVVHRITRVDKIGNIIYTYPNTSLNGVNISYQDHIKLVSHMHKTVFSDVITNVQGFQATALYVPVFTNMNYCGSIGILIDYDVISEKYFEVLKVGKNSYAWVISENGIELYSPISTHVGKSVLYNHRDELSLLSVAKKMQSGNEGTADYLSSNSNIGEHKEELYHAAFYPVRLYNTFWSICVTAPESLVLSDIQGFRNRCIAMLFFVAIIGGGFFLYLFRFTVQKRTKDSVVKQLDFLQTLVNTIPSPIFYKDIQGVYLGCNTAFEGFIGRPKAQVVGKTVYDIAPGALADEYHNTDLALFDSPGIQQYDASVQYADGSLHDIIFTKATFSESMGKVAGMVGVMLDITERRRAEEELKFKNIVLSTQQETSLDGILVVDEHNSVISLNRRFIEMFNVSPEQVEAKDEAPVLQLVAGRMADPEGFLARVEYLYEHREEKSREELLLKDGRVFDRYSAPLLGAECEYYGRVWYFRDITRRKKAEKEIRRLNRFYDVLSQVNQAIVRIQSKDELLSTVCRLVAERGAVDLVWIGWLDPETSGIDPVARFGNKAPMLSEVHFCGDHGQTGQSNPWRGIREGKPFVCNECDSRCCLYPAGPASAHSGFGSCGSFPLRFQGEVCGALTLCVSEQGFFEEREIALLDEVAVDISFALDKIEGDSQRERLKEEFQQQSTFLYSLMNSMPNPVFYKDTDLRYLGCNAAFEQIIGKHSVDIIGKTVDYLWPENLADYSDRLDRELLASTVEQITPYNWIFETREGNFKHFLAHKAVFRNNDGSPGGIIGVMLDITERKAAEAAVQESEAKFRSYVENAPLAVLVVDREGRILDFNRSALDLLGYDAAILGGMNVNQIHPDEDREIFLRDFATLLDKGRVEMERRIKRADGEVRWVGMHVAMISDQISIGYCQDITERKEAEEERTRIEKQLRQAQKMEALGTLAGGIAHDFNNILGIIMGFTQLATYELDKGSPVLDELGEVLKAADRAKDLVKQILAFSRRSEQRMVPLQLGLIVKEAMHILRPSLPSTIEIKTDVSSNAAIFADPTQMHQVLMNLCTNAAYAMQDNGGVLEVRLADIALATGHAACKEGLKPGSYVELTVRDNGHGIDPSTVDSIFDPFFTTKGLGEGTGLGLSVVHGIVKNLEGAIHVESTLEKGTTFTVLIPVPKTGNEPKKQEMAVALSRGHERILVVDDEPLLAETIKRMLEKQGYEVVSLTSGIEALEAFRLQPTGKSFDLVITDMTMPHFTGVDLARELSGFQPPVPVILMSGFSNKVDADKAKEMGIEGFLMKPVAMTELAAMVRTVLDRRTM